MKETILDLVVFHYVLGFLLFILTVVVAVCLWFRAELLDYLRSRRQLKRMAEEVAELDKKSEGNQGSPR